MSLPQPRPSLTRAAAPGRLTAAASAQLFSRQQHYRPGAGEEAPSVGRRQQQQQQKVTGPTALLPRVLYAALGGLMLLQASSLPPRAAPGAPPPPRARAAAAGSRSGGGARRSRYVAIACTLSAYARKEDYDYLVAVTAANWDTFGFTPILVAVADSQQRIDEVRKAWDLLLPKEAIVLPVVVPREASVSAAQMSRLYAATAALRRGHLRPSDFVRVTDADMIIMKSKPFLPVPGADVDIYNGRCCLGHASHVVEGRRCRQYPMHSVGMSAGMWSALFPLNGAGDDGADVDVGRFVLGLAKAHFGYDPMASPREGGGTVRHGQRRLWFMDQLLLGCAIDGAIERGYNVTLSPIPGKRFDRMKGPIRNGYVDVHLPRFRLDLAEHRAWMDRLVNETVVLADRYKDRYARYTEEWLRLRSEKAKAAAPPPAL